MPRRDVTIWKVRFRGFPYHRVGVGFVPCERDDYVETTRLVSRFRGIPSVFEWKVRLASLGVQ